MHGIARSGGADLLVGGRFVTVTRMFVVILTGDAGQVVVQPRAVGPFDDFDAAQEFSQALTAQYEAEGGEHPTATVARVEEPMPGVVVGEI